MQERKEAIQYILEHKNSLTSESTQGNKNNKTNKELLEKIKYLNLSESQFKNFITLLNTSASAKNNITNNKIKQIYAIDTSSPSTNSNNPIIFENFETLRKKIEEAKNIPTVNVEPEELEEILEEGNISESSVEKSSHHPVPVRPGKNNLPLETETETETTDLPLPLPIISVPEANISQKNNKKGIELSPGANIESSNTEDENVTQESARKKQASPYDEHQPQPQPSSEYQEVAEKEEEAEAVEEEEEEQLNKPTTLPSSPVLNIGSELVSSSSNNNTNQTRSRVLILKNRVGGSRKSKKQNKSSSRKKNRKFPKKSRKSKKSKTNSKNNNKNNNNNNNNNKKKTKKYKN